MRRSKRASLSLSINAIVILVLAIAMLGLGLSFTKGMFKKFGEKLTVPPPDLPATAGEPIVLPTDEIEVKHGKESIFQVNYYNDHSQAIVEPFLDCGDGGPSNCVFPGAGTGSCFNHINPEDPNYGLYVVVAPQTVKGGESKPFKFILLKEATDAEGTTVPDMTGKQAICEVGFNHPGGFEDTRQITIKVT